MTTNKNQKTKKSKVILNAHEPIKSDCISTVVPYFKHQNIYFYNADSLHKNLFSKEFIDIIITSPPYNVDLKYGDNNTDNLTYEQYLKFSENWMNNCYQWSKPEARFLLNIPLDKNKGGQYSVGADLTRIAQDVGWKYHATIVWNEGNISRRTAWGSWKSASAPFVITPVELIVILYKDQWKKTGGSQESDISRDEFMEWTNGLWTFNGESKKKLVILHHFPENYQNVVLSFLAMLMMLYSIHFVVAERLY